MSTKDGGPAFPSMYADGAPDGMSLRDYFAAQAVSRLLEYMLKEYEDDEPFTKAASDAYMLADAMLKARAK